MLSDKLIDLLKQNGWWFDDYSQSYVDVLNDLNIPLTSTFAQFYLHAEDGPVFLSKGIQLYQICWFSIHSTYNYDLERTHQALHLPVEYIPLDSFEGEGGFFYNRLTGEVLELNLGQNLQDFPDGKLQPQWKDFNSFLEWYFEIDD